MLSAKSIAHEAEEANSAKLDDKNPPEIKIRDATTEEKVQDAWDAAWEEAHRYGFASGLVYAVKASKDPDLAFEFGRLCGAALMHLNEGEPLNLGSARLDPENMLLIFGCEA